MKDQVLFSLKDKSKKLKCHLLQFLIGTLRVNFILFQKNLTVDINVAISPLIDKIKIQSNFRGSNTFGAMKISSSQG